MHLHETSVCDEGEKRCEQNERDIFLYLYADSSSRDDSISMLMRVNFQVCRQQTRTQVSWVYHLIYITEHNQRTAHKSLSLWLLFCMLDCISFGLFNRFFGSSEQKLEKDANTFVSMDSTQRRRINDLTLGNRVNVNAIAMAISQAQQVDQSHECDNIARDWATAQAINVCATGKRRLSTGQTNKQVVRLPLDRRVNFVDDSRKLTD